jgi:methionine aminopeptidase
MLKEGDVAKIDLGVHIDGYVAVAAHTVVVKADQSKVTEGREADVILAAYNAI